MLKQLIIINNKTNEVLDCCHKVDCSHEWCNDALGVGALEDARPLLKDALLWSHRGWSGTQKTTAAWSARLLRTCKINSDTSWKNWQKTSVCYRLRRTDHYWWCNFFVCQLALPPRKYSTAAARSRSLWSLSCSRALSLSLSRSFSLWLFSPSPQ